MAKELMIREKIPLLIIYKDGSKIVADMPETILDLYQLYGFLKIYCEDMKSKLLEGLED